MAIRNFPFLSPLRYFGSKDWSIFGRIFKGRKETPGYHRKAEKISKVEALKFKAFIAMTEACFTSKQEKLDEYSLEIIKPEIPNLPKTVQSKEKCLFDPTTGLKVTIIKKGEETFVAFGCIYSGYTEVSTKKEQSAVVRRQYLAAVKNVAGLDAKLFNQAEEVFSKIKEQHSNIRLVGGCLGGTIASYVGLRQDVPTIAINGLPIGVALQHKIGRKKLANADNVVEHLVVKGDQFSDSPILKILDRILSFIGIRTPGNFGIRKTIPSMFKTAKETHEKVMKSLNNYCAEDA